MSDLATLNHVKPASPQLPVSWYFDPAIFQLEKELLFNRGANYVGHELTLPNVGDYRTLEWEGHARVLVRNAGSIELLSNVCRHRQAIMLEGSGNLRRIACPFHRWNYDLHGALIGAPHFPQNPGTGLHSTPLFNWNGLLFEGPRDPNTDLATLGAAIDFDFSGYRLGRTMIEDYPTNWKTFVEVYLELYHVDPYHPGLGNFADCGDFRIEYGDNWSIQYIAAKNGFARPGTPGYGPWHEACRKYLNGRTPKYGALWMSYYPNIMLEWYPNVLVVSTLLARSPALTTNVVEIYYPEDIVSNEPEFIRAQQQAYVETAIEDAILCERMDRGRRALWERGLDDRGPYQSPMEDAEMHFHEWMRRNLPAGIASA
jgi:choline monooxygenase